MHGWMDGWMDGWISVYLSFYQISLSIYLSIYISMYLSTYLSVSLNLFIYLYISLSSNLHFDMCVSIYPSCHLSNISSTTSFSSWKLCKISWLKILVKLIYYTIDLEVAMEPLGILCEKLSDVFVMVLMMITMTI